jgi:predicted enzyme related to lactoylglutathione lyase
LKATEAAIIEAGGRVVVPTFEFPGGRRFHFSDGAGNVLAVWSE